MTWRRRWRPGGRSSWSACRRCAGRGRAARATPACWRDAWRARAAHRQCGCALPRPSGGTLPATPHPAPLPPNRPPRHAGHAARGAQVDDQLAELFLSEEPVAPQELAAAIRRATLANKFVPVFMGSAYKNKGVCVCVCVCGWKLTLAGMCGGGPSMVGWCDRAAGVPWADTRGCQVIVAVSPPPPPPPVRVILSSSARAAGAAVRASRRAGAAGRRVRLPALPHRRGQHGAGHRKGRGGAHAALQVCGKHDLQPRQRPRTSSRLQGASDSLPSLCAVCCVRPSLLHAC
jgi:hypothetical protein